MWFLWYIVSLAFVPLLIRTYRTKKPALLWMLILAPPFLLSPLALVPIRDPLILGIVWLPILPYLPASIIILIVRIVSLIMHPKDKMLKIKLVRPALVVVVFAMAFTCHRISRHMADCYVLQLAQEIQLNPTTMVIARHQLTDGNLANSR
jgi:hypothetical protein